MSGISEDYIGMDPPVGLECSMCTHVTRINYSILLTKIFKENSQIDCENCERQMTHDYTTVAEVEKIIKRRMEQTLKEKEIPANSPKASVTPIRK